MCTWMNADRARIRRRPSLLSLPNFVYCGTERIRNGESPSMKYLLRWALLTPVKRPQNNLLSAECLVRGTGSSDIWLVTHSVLDMQPHLHFAADLSITFHCLGRDRKLKKTKTKEKIIRV